MQLLSIQLTTQPTTPINYYFIYLCVMSHTMKLQKFPYFSALSLYTLLFLVFYRYNPNIKFIPITIPFPIHIPSIFYYQNLLWNAYYLCIISDKNFPIIFLNITYQFNSVRLTMIQCHIHYHYALLAHSFVFFLCFLYFGQQRVP